MNNWFLVSFLTKVILLEYTTSGNFGNLLNGRQINSDVDNMSEELTISLYETKN